MSIELTPHASLGAHRHNVVCVIVTYGDRRAMLLQVLDSLPSQGIKRIVVVNNGAHWPVRNELVSRYRDFVDVVELPRNSGSAAGYAAGIRRALELGEDYVWLLDDDNRPTVSCLAALLGAYDRLRIDTDVTRLGVVAFRSHCQAQRYMATGSPQSRINGRSSSFLGFHVLDIPVKMWRRTPWGKNSSKERLLAWAPLTFAPYSGFLFHREAANTIGLPREDFVLYADDKEYTHRITLAGGSIALVTGAVVEDLEASWNVQANGGSSFHGVLRQGSDFRAYYSARNGAYFSAYCSAKSPVLLKINYCIYVGILSTLARLGGHLDRYQLLRDAYRNGLSGRLGEDARFPLS